jgi:hypothetical protein
MTQKFVATFLFESQYPIVDQSLQVVREKFFEEAPNLPLEKEEDEWIAPLQKLLAYVSFFPARCSKSLVDDIFYLLSFP